VTPGAAISAVRIRSKRLEKRVTSSFSRHKGVAPVLSGRAGWQARATLLRVPCSGVQHEIHTKTLSTFQRGRVKKLSNTIGPRKMPGTVHPKTEELLNMLLWTLDTAMRPTYRNLSESYEGWAYRNGFLRQVDRLADGGFLERRGGGDPDTRVYRLTESGRLHALGGRDPAREWGRHWDGKWRLVLFDIVQDHASHRDRLRRYLRSKGFGYLQDSVWVSPHPLEAESDMLAGSRVDVESLVLLEARPVAGESDAEIVRGAWDFAKINKRYAAVLAVLETCPLDSLNLPGVAKKLKDWARRERVAWLAAVTDDPLLPRKLRPTGYLGERAWLKRTKIFNAMARRIGSFASDESDS